MKNLKGMVAAITGAGSGIGQALAVELAKHGCHVAISDINESGLQETEQQAKSYGVEEHSSLLDVASKDAVYEWADKVANEMGGVNLVFNNAGVSLSETIESMSYENFEWLMNINFWGVVYGTKAFLPHLKASGEGHVVNISSVFGMIGVPSQAAYNAAKFAVKGFTECLREEMELDEGNVKVTCVHPGGIKTNIMRSSRLGNVGKAGTSDKDRAVKMFDRAARTTPEQAAKVIVDGVKKDKPRVLIGNDARMIDAMQRLLPTGYQDILVWGTKRNYKKHNG